MLNSNARKYLSQPGSDNIYGLRSPEWSEFTKDCDLTTLLQFCRVNFSSRSRLLVRHVVLWPVIE